MTVKEDRQVSPDICLQYASHFLVDFSNELHAYPLRLKSEIRDKLGPIDKSLCEVIEALALSNINEISSRITSLLRELHDLGIFLLSKDKAAALISIAPSFRAQTLVLEILREENFSKVRLKEHLEYLCEEQVSGFNMYFMRFQVAKSLVLTVDSYIKADQFNKSYWTFDIDDEYRSPTTSILSFFQEVLITKFPELNPEVSVSQKKNSIQLLVEINSNNTEVIENEFIEYGKVVLGEQLPSEYFEDRAKVMQLETRLELTRLELKQAVELRSLEKENFVSQIGLLSDQLQYMQSIFNSKSDSISIFEELAKNQNKIVINALATIQKVVENGLENTDENLVLNELAKVKNEDPKIIDALKDYILKGAIQGASGNYLYSWLQVLSGLVR